jgi:hypothetical protein
MELVCQPAIFSLVCNAVSKPYDRLLWNLDYQDPKRIVSSSSSRQRPKWQWKSVWLEKKETRGSRGRVYIEIAKQDFSRCWGFGLGVFLAWVGYIGRGPPSRSPPEFISSRKQSRLRRCQIMARFPLRPCADSNFEVRQLLLTAIVTRT